MLTLTSSTFKHRDGPMKARSVRDGGASILQQLRSGFVAGGTDTVGLLARKPQTRATQAQRTLSVRTFIFSHSRTRGEGSFFGMYGRLGL
jgi:hypothetical protein